LKQELLNDVEMMFSKQGSVKLQPGELNIELDFNATGNRQGSGTLLVNGQEVAAGELGLTFSGFPYEGLDIGKDARSPVS